MKFSFVSFLFEKGKSTFRQKFYFKQNDEMRLTYFQTSFLSGANPTNDS
jgi:hypothetical protein